VSTVVTLAVFTLGSFFGAFRLHRRR